VEGKGDRIKKRRQSALMKCMALLDVGCE